MRLTFNLEQYDLVVNQGRSLTPAQWHLDTNEYGWFDSTSFTPSSGSDPNASYLVSQLRQEELRLPERLPDAFEVLFNEQEQASFSRTKVQNRLDQLAKWVAETHMSTPEWYTGY